MTDEELQAIQERCDYGGTPWDETFDCKRHHAFVQHAHADVPALLAEVKRLREMEQRANQLFEPVHVSIQSPEATFDDFYNRSVFRENELHHCLAEVERLRALVPALQSLLEFAERCEEQIEGEWGSCRSLEQLEKAGDLSQEIINARAALARLGGVA